MFSRKKPKDASPVVPVGVQLELGMSVKDQITGFAGVVTGKTEYLTGCKQYLVQSKLEKLGEYPPSAWLDEGRLVITDPISSFRQPAEASNGPDRPAPKK